jgi:hypothetical protein
MQTSSSVRRKTCARLWAELAGVERLVVCTSQPPEDLLVRVRASRMDYVVLKLGTQRRRGRSRRLRSTAEAIDAADDLGGHPRLEIDLNDAVSRRSLDPG